ncbi:hypothetical protein Patl1_19937 [Pistacia atlantica]|uniref:Uncharacterized protein n=1 Tax=Pistacia atlantica TaxID=434234 RepID=A0ACC1BKS4_9ROSI|nr:hypothetical protein Patl1_19937 [Pistacia atlantica]
MMKNESAFLLAWLGIGGVILLQGITLAASGFLPEELDKFFVKYLYPTFTPTVVLFVAGTVAYGVLNCFFSFARTEPLNAAAAKSLRKDQLTSVEVVHGTTCSHGQT